MSRSKEESYYQHYSHNDLFLEETLHYGDQRKHLEKSNNQNSLIKDA